MNIPFFRTLIVFICLLTFCNHAYSQNVSGKVTSTNGENLIGVSVNIKGTNIGTITDGSGSYSLTAQKNVTLVFSFVGFSKREILVTGQTNINVSLTEDSENLDEVIVTGVFDKRSRMESSVAISVLTTKQLQQQVPLSATDLLKNIPGVFVNSSLGEIRNTVYSRGISVGSNDGNSGFTYVSMQEDGLPITNATFVNYGPDYFLRPDVTLAKVEAVRGGTASILGNNAPGGIFNYVSKTGGRIFTAEARARFGLEGNGKNPYYRADLNFGGPLNKDKSLTYNIGGFWRQSDGARNPGYPMNNGGQVKANIVKTTKKGSIKLYAKYLDDHNAWFEFLPTINFNDPQLPAGIEQTNSVLIPAVKGTATINQTNEVINFDSRDKVHSQDLSFGLNIDHDFGNGLVIDNKVRYSAKNTLWNATIVVFPFAVDNIIWYAITNNIARFGNYSFKDINTGTELANVTQAPNIVNGQFAGFNFNVNNANLPGASVQKNSILFNPLFYQKHTMGELTDQLSITKRLDNMSFTAGMFYSYSSLKRHASQNFGEMHSLLTSPTPTPTLISVTGFDGKTYQITNKDGVEGASGKSAAVNIVDATQSDFALFFGHNWAINNKLNFDWGLRYETITIKGDNQIASVVPSSKPGGTDGNELTLYDNTEGKITSTYSYNKTVPTFSFSGGLNYMLNDDMAVYSRYSQGRKAPDMDMYVGINTDAGRDFLNPVAQNTQQLEIGFKAKTGNLNLFVTPFYSILGNVATASLGQETDDIHSTYSTPFLYNKFVTKGVEVEGIYNFTKNFKVRAVGTFQSSTAVDYNIYDVGQNGAKDDKIVSYSGNETDNNAKTMIRVSPNYSTDKFYVSADFSYMGKRAANVPNAFYLPAFTQTDFNIGYNINYNIQLQGNINNVFNQQGVMSWAAPGGFPAALNRQGFTKANLEANPNAVYSSVSIPPRAYFLTLTYRF